MLLAKAKIRVGPWVPPAPAPAQLAHACVQHGGAVLLADSFNVMGGWLYYPAPEERIEAGVSQRLVVRITAPTDALTLNGTLVSEEIGQMPVASRRSGVMRCEASRLDLR